MISLCLVYVSRNGASSSSPLFGKFCGTTIPKIFKSHSNKLYLKFYSDISNHSPGFEIEYDSTSTGCGGIVSGYRGSVTSPNYPEHYYSNTVCTWKIQVNKGSTIQLVFNDIDMESTQNSCYYDYVEVYDGPDMTSKRLGRYCNPDHDPLHLTSTTNQVFIRMASDSTDNGRGFSLRYVANCNTTLSNYFGVIESPNYPNSYPSNINCRWAIHAPMGSKVHIEFETLSLEQGIDYYTGFKSCKYDYVKIVANDRNEEKPQETRGPFCDTVPTNLTFENNNIEIL